MKRHVKLFKIFPILKLKWNIIMNSKVMVQLRTLGFQCAGYPQDCLYGFQSKSLCCNMNVTAMCIFTHTT